MKTVSLCAKNILRQEQPYSNIYVTIDNNAPPQFLGRSKMALTREFKDTIAGRVQRDPRFREALFTEAMNAYLGGDTKTGKAMLRDLVNATIGFEELAHVLRKSSKSLHRMLAPHGNRNTEHFFGIVNALQKKARVKLLVKAKAV